MIYPAIIFVVIVIVVAVMIMYMVPAVEDLYADFGVEELPWVTSFLVSLSHFLSSPIGCSSVSIIVVSIVFGYKYYYSTESGRLLIDKLMLKLPIFGQLISKVHIAEFSRLLSMLLKSGVSIVEALQIVSSALNNIHFKNALLEGKEDIKNGLPIAVALSKSEVYPPLIVKMVAIGEETGKLDSVLEDMAKFYDDEVNEMTDNLNKLMEPMILIIVGGVVAFLAIGIYLPIYSIGQSI